MKPEFIPLTQPFVLMKTYQLRHLTTILALLSLVFIGGMCTKPKDPEPVPIASFYYSPQTNLVAPVTVTFRNSSKYAESYLWTYAGQTDTDKDIRLIFSRAGSYPITLQATGKGGTDSYTETILIDAPTNPTTDRPKADFIFTPNQNLVAPVKITFKNTSQNADSYSWLVEGNGEKSTSTQTNLEFNFVKEGSYTVHLFATKNGASSELAQIITIGKAPTAFTLPGQVVFWATGSWDYVDVETEGTPYQKVAGGPYYSPLALGRIKKLVSTAPACDATDFFTTERAPKTYSYKATAYRSSGAKIAEASGNYTVEEGKCTSVRIDFSSIPPQSNFGRQGKADDLISIISPKCSNVYNDLKYEPSGTYDHKITNVGILKLECIYLDNGNAGRIGRMGRTLKPGESFLLIRENTSSPQYKKVVRIIAYEYKYVTLNNGKNDCYIEANETINTLMYKEICDLIGGNQDCYKTK